MAQVPATLSQSSITCKIIQQFPESMTGTARKVALFVQRNKNIFTSAACMASLLVSPPLLFEASVVIVLVVAGLRTAEYLLPRDTSETFRKLADMEAVDRGMLILAGAIASIATFNPLLFKIASCISIAHDACDIPKTLFS